MAFCILYAKFYIIVDQLKFSCDLMMYVLTLLFLLVVSVGVVWEICLGCKYGGAGQKYGDYRAYTL
jgi:hypothetical protein